jgi:hypothetical protein
MRVIENLFAFLPVIPEKIRARPRRTSTARLPTLVVHTRVGGPLFEPCQARLEGSRLDGAQIGVNQLGDVAAFPRNEISACDRGDDGGASGWMRPVPRLFSTARKRPWVIIAPERSIFGDDRSCANLME